MKKLLLAFVCVFALATLVACGNNNGTENGTENVTEKEYKLGMGADIQLSAGQINATVATVVVDKDGKIVACRLDVAQNKFTVEEGEVIKTDFAKTKREKLYEYNMKGTSDNNGDGIVLEWFEQAEKFEAYVVGKTGEEVAALETQSVNNHNISKDEALLKAGCTIDITAFQAAVAKACADEFAVSFKASEFKLGLAITSFDDGSKSATDEADGAVKIYSDFAASVVVDGKIVASLNDAIQPSFKVTFDEVTADAFKGTKREQKEGYNMAQAINYDPKYDPNNDGKVLEWYLQSQAFSAHVVGMTGEQVANMDTAKNSLNYDMSTDADLLKAGCTIQITAIKAVVAKSVTNAR